MPRSRPIWSHALAAGLILLSLVLSARPLAAIPCFRSELYAPDTAPLIHEESRFTTAFHPVIAGNHAYVADRAGLKIFDLTDHAHPVLVGALNTPGLCWDVAVVGNVAYLADDSAGLAIIDIGDPTSPRVLATQPIPGLTSGVDVEGGLAYCASQFGGGLFIVDVTTPASPQIVGEYRGASLVDVDVVGIYALVVGGPSMLMALDVSDPTSPVQLGSMFFEDAPTAVAVTGNLACVTLASNSGSLEGGLALVDVGNPYDPFGYVVYEFDYPAHGLAVNGSLAHVGADALYTFEISNPSALVPLSMVGSSAYGVALSDDRVLTAGYNGLFHHDFADPSDPVLLGSVETAGPLRAVGAGSGLVLVNDGDLQIYGFINPLDPWLVSTLNVLALDIEVHQRKAYLAGSNFTVLDLADPVSPVITHEEETETRLGIALDEAGERICLGGILEVGVWDLDDPLVPEHRSTWPVPSTVYSVAWSGDHVVCGRNGYFDIIDLSDLDNPMPVISIPIATEAQGVATDGDILAVAMGSSFYGHNGSLILYSLADPANPVQLGSVGMPELADNYSPMARDVQLRGSLAYVAAENGGIVVVDISDPTAPVIQGRLATASHARKIALGSDFVVVADRFGGLAVSALQCEELIAVPEGPTSADNLILAPPYPNPFNPSVTLPLSLAHDQDVRLAVYDTAGKLVRTVYHGHLAAGDHQWSWHGRDDRGRAMPSGMYHLRLETEHDVFQRRMMLLR